MKSILPLTSLVVDGLSDPASYHILVTYPEGETQNLVPALHDFNGFSAWLDARGYSFVIDSFTGIVGDGGTVVFRGILDYCLQAPVGLSGTVDINTSTDLPHDGISVIYVDSDVSKQTNYGLMLQ